jgi:hypothetical protein
MLVEESCKTWLRSTTWSCFFFKSGDEYTEPRNVRLYGDRYCEGLRNYSHTMYERIYTCTMSRYMLQDVDSSCRRIVEDLSQSLCL